MEITKAKIVQSVDGQLVVSNVAIENLIAAMEVRGGEVSGVESNSRVRLELQGQPTFTNFIGPCYDGEGQIRYEDSGAYAILSA